jgi:hypothetical protein
MGALGFLVCRLTRCPLGDLGIPPSGYPEFSSYEDMGGGGSDPFCCSKTVLGRPVRIQKRVTAHERTHGRNGEFLCFISNTSYCKAAVLSRGMIHWIYCPKVRALMHDEAR